MKIQAILEFDLEAWDGVPVNDRELFDLAAQDTDHAIRTRLMGSGFLDTDAIIRIWTLRVSVRADPPGEPDPPD